MYSIKPRKTYVVLFKNFFSDIFPGKLHFTAELNLYNIHIYFVNVHLICSVKNKRLFTSTIYTWHFKCTLVQIWQKNTKHKEFAKWDSHITHILICTKTHIDYIIIEIFYMKKTLIYIWLWYCQLCSVLLHVKA